MWPYASQSLDVREQKKALAITDHCINKNFSTDIFCTLASLRDEVNTPKHQVNANGTFHKHVEPEYMWKPITLMKHTHLAFSVQNGKHAYSKEIDLEFLIYEWPNNDFQLSIIDLL